MPMLSRVLLQRLSFLLAAGFAVVGISKDIFVLQVPVCAGERLLSYDGSYKGDAYREQFYRQHEWVFDLLRRLHFKMLCAAAASEDEASLFYIPAFFALLIKMHDAASLECLVAAARAVTSTVSFRRNAGYDHFYLHGLEHPVLADFGPAEAVVNAFYATMQNAAIVATGDLSQGTLAAALGGALYGMRRIITVPFLMSEVSELEASVQRDVRVTFAGTIQSYNLERVLFYQAVALEFNDKIQEHANGRVVLDDARVQLRVWVRLAMDVAPFNATERTALTSQRKYLHRLYSRSEICIVAPGDAPVLGQRLSDTIGAGCLPAVLVTPGKYPVLPLQGSIQWGEFAIILRVGDVGDVMSARIALRKLLSMSQAEVLRRQRAMYKWRSRLILERGPDCTANVEGPDAGELVLEELRGLRDIWSRQLPTGMLDLNASACRVMGPSCGALAGFLPNW